MGSAAPSVIHDACLLDGTAVLKELLDVLIRHLEVQICNDPA